ncbi:hypothetical protein DdX_14517 [Ditylenchus destructor]|uniref:Uncharacterized protein n=1 Tax=Ditylenchus destructor TaxID=166010 RepID=A0AAD4MUF6_9BILA|nr:hypothetical protein DdX_14517 [Ditylenchus destructor]
MVVLRRKEEESVLTKSENIRLRREKCKKFVNKERRIRYYASYNHSDASEEDQKTVANLMRMPLQLIRGSKKLASDKKLNELEGPTIGANDFVNCDNDFGRKTKQENASHKMGLVPRQTTPFFQDGMIRQTASVL